MPRWPLGPGFPLELCRQYAFLSLAGRRGPLWVRLSPLRGGSGELCGAGPRLQEEPWPCRQAGQGTTPACPEGPPSPECLHLWAPDCTLESLVESLEIMMRRLCRHVSHLIELVFPCTLSQENASGSHFKEDKAKKLPLFLSTKFICKNCYSMAHYF